MKDYVKEIKELQKTLSDCMNQISENRDDKELCFTLCRYAQQKMIELGTLLETEANLVGSKIINWLEVTCEFFYQLIKGVITIDVMKQYMSWYFQLMERAYYWSVPKGAHELSIAAIIKNERNIIEWIEYHLMVGVSHFYIYDNESTDNLKEKLQLYIEKGIVTYIYFPGKYQQHPASNHAIHHFKYETKWLAIIDGDEYIVPVKEGVKLPQLLDEIEDSCINHPLRDMMFVGAIGVNWRDYGTSGHKTSCEGLVIENYKYRAEDDYFQNVHIKSIYNPRVVSSIENPHFGNLYSNWVCISEKGSHIPGAYFYDSRCEKIRINHYFSKSEEELVAKNQRGWPDRDLQRNDARELYEAGVNCNKVYDPIMERYVDELKQRVANKGILSKRLS